MWLGEESEAHESPTSLSFDVCGSSKLLLSVMYWQSYSVVNVFTITASLNNVIMYFCKDLFFVWDVQNIFMPHEDVALYLCLSK
jgi:hypothetical protein